MKQTLLHGLFPTVRAEVLRLLFTNAAAKESGPGFAAPPSVG